jgi:AcrR family transcriptional regulator
MVRASTSRPPLTTSERVLQAAAELLRTGGVDAVSTRAVAAAADVQPPTIYRQIGDKEDLLDAVAHYVLQEYTATKRQVAIASDDPVQDLRELWDLHVEFGLSNPAAYSLAYGEPRVGRVAAAAVETIAILQGAVARLGDQGRLRMSVDRATKLVHAGGVGIVLTLISDAPANRDMSLSSIVRENALSAILNSDESTPTASSELPARAVALGEALRATDNSHLTAAERALLVEWLRRLADQG